MKITKLDQTPREVTFPREPDAPNVSEKEVEDIIEVFKTPLEGSFNWDYTEADNRMLKLYELGKKLNWNGSIDVDWNKPLSSPPNPDNIDFWDDFEPYAKMSREDKVKFFQHRHAWQICQFLHGEQGALLVASQLATTAPTFNAKLYATSQTFDEARHVEVFNRYLNKRVNIRYPIQRGLKALIDKILQDSRWDLKFIGMQIVIEGLALAAFKTIQNHTSDEVLKELLEYVLRDEARHVTFGVNYLEDFIATLSEEEREARADFAFEACLISRDRLVSYDLYEHFGWPVQDAVDYMLEKQGNSEFRNLLFSRVIPNLKRIGLLTDRVREKYDRLGLLSYEEQPDDWEIDWPQLSRPLKVGQAD